MTVYEKGPGVPEDPYGAFLPIQKCKLAIGSSQEDSVYWEGPVYFPKESYTSGHDVRCLFKKYEQKMRTARWK